MLLRATAFFVLLAAAVVRLALFHRAALYPIPFLSLIGSDALLAAPYLLPAFAVFVVRRVPFPTVLLLILTVLVVSTGVFLDYNHFAHLNKESVFDGVYYLGHIAISMAGTVFLLIFNAE
jgi:hypothetical protein